MLARAAERRSYVLNPLHPRDPALVDYFGGGGTSASGETVNATTAMQEETVLACVRYIAETMAALPAGVFQRQEPSGRKHRRDHWLDSRLHFKPNRWQTPFDFTNLLMNWILLRGDWYFNIKPSNEMPPFEFMPLHPDRMRHVELENGQRFYDYLSPKGETIRLRYGEVCHLSFMPTDGWKGRSVISYAADTIGRALATGNAVSRTFRNNSAPGGILKVKRRLSPQAKKTLREDFEALHQGAANKGRFAVFEEDMDWQPVSMSNSDAQALEIMQANVISITRIFNVKPHKVNSLEEAKWANIEHQQIDSVVDTILPWVVRHEQTYNKDLFAEAEQRDGFYTHYNLDGLLRGDFKTRQEGRAIQRQWGIISGNEWAESEDMNHYDGGEKRLVPLNMVDLNAPPAPAPSEARRLWNPGDNTIPPLRETRSLELMRRLRAAHLPVLEEASRRLLRREADTVERQFRRQAQDRSLAGFTTWLATFYEEQRSVIAQTMTPGLSALAATVEEAARDLMGSGEPIEMDAFLQGYAGALASRHTGASRDGLLSLVNDEDAATVLTRADTLFKDWRTDRPARMAAAEAVRLSNAVSRFVWQGLGVEKLSWWPSGECEECNALAGKIISLREEFAPGVSHGPLHDGCQCSIAPVVQEG